MKMRTAKWCSASRRGATFQHATSAWALADPAPARLKQASSELAELEQALAASQQHLRFAEERIETLVRRESRLKQRFLRLAQKAAEVRHVACHDELTGLPNRSLLLDRFNQAVAQGARQGRHWPYCSWIWTDSRASTTDWGMQQGDKLLQQVASRLSACIRACDTACRYGGDEFVVMLPEVGGHDSAARVAEKVRSRLAAPYAVEGSTITVPASIGTAVYPVDGHDYGDLIKQSDLDMYRAKTQ